MTPVVVKSHALGLAVLAVIGVDARRARRRDRPRCSSFGCVVEIGAARARAAACRSLAEPVAPLVVGGVIDRASVSRGSRMRSGRPRGCCRCAARSSSSCGAAARDPRRTGPRAPRSSARCAPRSGASRGSRCRSCSFVLVLVAGGSAPVIKASSAYTGLGAPIARGVRKAFDRDRDGYSRFLGGGDCDDGDRDRPSRRARDSRRRHRSELRRRRCEPRSRRTRTSRSRRCRASVPKDCEHPPHHDRHDARRSPRRLRLQAADLAEPRRARRRGHRVRRGLGARAVDALLDAGDPDRPPAARRLLRHVGRRLARPRAEGDDARRGARSRSASSPARSRTTGTSIASRHMDQGFAEYDNENARLHDGVAGAGPEQTQGQLVEGADRQGDRVRRPPRRREVVPVGPLLRSALRLRAASRGRRRSAPTTWRSTTARSASPISTSAACSTTCARRASTTRRSSSSPAITARASASTASSCTAITSTRRRRRCR